jgi:hypothetical protein
LFQRKDGIPNIGNSSADDRYPTARPTGFVLRKSHGQALQEPRKGIGKWAQGTNKSFAIPRQ